MSASLTFVPRPGPVLATVALASSPNSGVTVATWLAPRAIE